MNERDVGIVRQGPTQRADDTLGGGALQPERRADGEHPLPDLEAAGIADGRDRQVLGIDLQQRDIGLRVAADQFGRELALVIQFDGNFVRAIHHMMVGDDITVGGNDESGTQALQGHPLAAGRLGEGLEIVAEGFVAVIEIRHSRPHDHRRALAGDADIHDRRRILLDQRAEIGDGHFHPRRRRGIQRQRWRRQAGRQHRAARRQSDSHCHIFEPTGNLHDRTSLNLK